MMMMIMMNMIIKINGDNMESVSRTVTIRMVIIW